MVRIAIVIHSAYGHVLTLAKSIQGAAKKAAPEATVDLYKVAETLPAEVVEKLHAQNFDLPVITPDLLKSYDGFLFGIPTRFGTMPAQIKAFLDSCGGLWATGALNGKFGGLFFSTATQHGGQETTAYTFLPFFAHHGVNWVPLGFPPQLNELSEIVGGSPYGSGTIAGGDGSRQPSAKELEVAELQGANFAKLLTTYHKGLSA